MSLLPNSCCHRISCIMPVEIVAVITANDQKCGLRREPLVIPVVGDSSTGYLSSAVTIDTGRGGPDCPWRLKASPGQRINITLINFARAPLPSSSPALTSPGGAGSQPPLAVGGSPSASLQNGIPPAITRPKICYPLADIRERQYARKLTECEGSPRDSHVFLSTSDTVEIDVNVVKMLKVHFLLHFQGISLRAPARAAGTLNGMELMPVYIRSRKSRPDSTCRFAIYSTILTELRASVLRLIDARHYILQSLSRELTADCADGCVTACRRRKQENL